MKKNYTEDFSQKKLKITRRKSVDLSQEYVVNIGNLQKNQNLPLLLEPNIEGLNSMSWFKKNRDFIKVNLLKYGGILFRNFNFTSVAEFEQLMKVISNDMMRYTYRSTPRSHVSGNVYTSTEYPAYQSIPLHNEMSYSHNWPLIVGFFCIQPSEQGGETPIADSRRILTNLNPKIVEKFRQKKVMYVRNYQDGLDLSWENVFQTTDKSEVENYCKSFGIDCEWKSSNHLRTRQVCQAIAIHPQTGESVWFNQAHLFHVSSLESSVRDFLFANFQEEDFPRNSYYGDGSPIEESVLEEIHQIYHQEKIIFPWCKGDILMLDNMLFSHGREPFIGSRKVVVAMAESFHQLKTSNINIS
ncbi:TauD/TfdA family dioxygenase [Mastigocoleus testarum]|uniref:Taurine catabolism dioxygenase TauD n=1 Tax=Mastigocoleus testarum BC008 TaxID=371196 RepID=A0A0V8A0X3_9CYAN|nr:TauD/TfdA family dioxygenase [Mastigocoleus testarum]KST70375.1 taurine catabolism dioxygenase TauD [Mastigocoleus testarum BC008]